jgi:hypothetical protein
VSAAPDDRPPSSGAPASSERRHADRVQIEGYAFETGEAAYTVIDISLGGLRLAYDDTQTAPPPGTEIVGAMTGAIARPLTLNAAVVWVDPKARQIGCTFPVLGRNIAGELLEILL